MAGYFAAGAVFAGGMGAAYKFNAGAANGKVPQWWQKREADITHLQEVVAMNRSLTAKLAKIKKIESSGVTAVDEVAVQDLLMKYKFDPAVTRYALQEAGGNVSNAEILLLGHHVKHTV